MLYSTYILYYNIWQHGNKLFVGIIFYTVWKRNGQLSDIDGNWKGNKDFGQRQKDRFFKIKNQSSYCVYNAKM